MTLSLPPDTNLLIQYTVVGAIVLAAAVWIGIRLWRLRGRKNQGGCCGCTLAETCTKAKKGPDTAHIKDIPTHIKDCH